MRNVIAATVVLIALFFFLGFTSGALYGTVTVCEKMTKSELEAAVCIALPEWANSHPKTPIPLPGNPLFGIPPAP